VIDEINSSIKKAVIMISLAKYIVKYNRLRHVT